MNASRQGKVRDFAFDPPSVLDGPESEGVDLLVESDQRHPDGEPLLPRVAHRLARRHHHLPRARLVALAVLLQEAPERVLLARQEADAVLVELHQPLQPAGGLVDGPEGRTISTRHFTRL